MIPGDGLNGIVSIFSVEDIQMMNGRSRDGRLFVDQGEGGEILFTRKSTVMAVT